nr:MAG TPA: hypothetical protein [Caudoviricetes sp.]DAN58705.1 MAG TPA: hypothetical protein [Caudoviricetes sp.]
MSFFCVMSSSIEKITIVLHNITSSLSNYNIPINNPPAWISIFFLIKCVYIGIT